MRDKLESIKNKFIQYFPKEKLLNKCENIRSIAKSGVAVFFKLTDKLGHKLSKIGIKANAISLVGFIIGLLAINFLSLGSYGLALTCILLNRFFDALDGAVARYSEPTDFGIFLDATLDYVFYAGVIFGFALANPAQNAIAAAFLLFAFTSSASAMLAYAIIAYKNNLKDKEILTQSPFYLGGFAQGFETLIALIVMCIIPGLFLQIAIVLGILSLVKAVSLIIAAYYKFVIQKSK